MAGPVLQALSSGFTSKQILDYLIRMFPGKASKIHSALAKGFSAEQVIKYLSGGRKALAQGEGTEYEQTRKTDLERTENVNNQAKNAALLAGGAAATPVVYGALQKGIPMAMGALGRAAPGAASALQRAAPQLVGPGALPMPAGATIGGNPSPPMMPPSSPTPNQAIPPSSNNVPSMPGTSQPPVSPTIPQNNPVAPPQVNPINSTEILTKTNSIGQIDNLLRSKNTPDAIKAYFQKFSPKTIQEVEKAAGIPFEQVVDDYISKKPAEISEQIQEEKPQKIEKSSSVITPDGMGQVKEIRNGKAIVEVDGKKHQIDEEELVASSKIPEEELGQLYNDLIEGIEKYTGQDVSRMVNFLGYDSPSNSAAFLGHSGALYIFEDLTPEHVEEIKNIEGIRKTSGENFIGAFTEGSSSPAGAATSAFIRKLQKERGGKGNEYSRKYKSVYSYLEPAVSASKELYKKNKKKKK